MTPVPGRFGIFNPELLCALQRVLQLTAPADETLREREARAAKLFFSLQFVRPSCDEPDVAIALPVLRSKALEHTGDRRSADELVEHTLELALDCPEIAAERSVIDWLLALLEFNAPNIDRKKAV